MKEKDITRNEEVEVDVNVDDYLAAKGILETIDNYLASDDVKIRLQKAHASLTEEAEAIIEALPEAAKAAVKDALDGVTVEEEFFVSNVSGMLKQDFASVMYALEEFVPVDATAEFSKIAIPDGCMNTKLEELAEKCAEHFLEAQKPIMLAVSLECAKSGDEARSIVETIMGKLPEDVLGIGLLMPMMSDLFGCDDDDEEEGGCEDCDGEDCCCGKNHEDGHECCGKCHHDDEECN